MSTAEQSASQDSRRGKAHHNHTAANVTIKQPASQDSRRGETNRVAREMDFLINVYRSNCAVLFVNDFHAYVSETLAIPEAIADVIACPEVHWNVMRGGV